MAYGLKDSEFNQISALFAKDDDIEKVILYGSRAKGNFKPFSDVDITLIGSKLSKDNLRKLVLALDESFLPYIFDVSIFSKLTNPDLISQIKSTGIVIYQKGIEAKKREA